MPRHAVPRRSVPSGPPASTRRFFLPFSHPPARVSDVNRPVVEEFRANAGRVGGMFEGGDLLLLTTVGARTGREQTVPLGFVREEPDSGDPGPGRLLVVASAGGAPRHPDWYRNLLAHPMVRVEVGEDDFGAVAVPLEGAARERAFAHVVERAPGYADHQAATARALPVVRLERPYADAPFTGFGDKLREVHTWLRAQLRHVRDETEAYFAARERGGTAAPPAVPGLRIRQHCLAFCESLHTHHTLEEQGALPAILRAHPHLAPAVERLRAEHRVVDALRARLVALLDGVAESDPERFRAELARMTRELEAHLDYEEEVLIPPLDLLPPPPG